MGQGANYARFDESTNLIRAGRYREALQILNELNEVHPNTRNVIYSAALCLEELGRPQKALPLCDELIEKFDDPRAHEMKARLERVLPLSAPLTVDPAISDSSSAYGYDSFQGLASTSTRPVQSTESSRWPWKQSLAWVGILSLLVLAAVGLWLWQELPPPASGENSPATTATTATTATPEKLLPRPLKPSPYTLPSRILFTLVFGVVVGTLAGYGALKAMSKLEGHNTITNLVHIAGTMLILQLIRVISRILQLGISAPDLALLVSVGAIVLSVYIMARAFKLSLGSFIVFAILYGVFAVLLVLPIGVVFGHSFQDLLLR